MKKYVYLCFLLACLSSCKKGQIIHIQFTDDEKKWIYYQNSNPTYAVYDFDTLTNVSGGDSIVLVHKPNIQSSVESFEGQGVDYEKGNIVYIPIFGYSQLNPPLFFPPYSHFLGYCKVDAIKDDESFKVSIGLVGIYDKKINISNTLDTALIQNNVFADVYKFIDTSTNYKCIYLAKNYGFIKIELKDGRKIELIKQ